MPTTISYQYKASNPPQKRSVTRFNEYGGTVGGPVWLPKLYNGRDRKTFFFFNYDGLCNISPTSTSKMSLPNADERKGDFSNSFVTASIGGVVTPYDVKIYGPLTATSTGQRQEFPNDIIPENRISDMAKKIMSLVPMPNAQADAGGTDSNNFIINQPKNDKFYSWAVRADQAWNNNHHSYAEYRTNDLWELAGDPFGPDNILVGNYLMRHNDGITLNHAWVISPSSFVNITANLTSWKTTTRAPANDVDATKYGFSSAFASATTIKGLPYIDGLWTAMGAMSGPSYENDYDYEVKGTWQKTYKNYTMRYGAEYMAQQEAVGNNHYGAGYYNFTNKWTVENPNATAPTGVGSNFATFLLGQPTSGYENNNATAFYSQPYIAVYAQDDWRTTRRLTLNFGLRYDYQLALTERHDRFYSRFDPDYDLTEITNVVQPIYATVISGSSTNTGVQLL